MKLRLTRIIKVISPRAAVDVIVNLAAVNKELWTFFIRYNNLLISLL